ncbi:GCN5-related N-acetyltransferase [Novosphingobium nitrogenifigens DSM 19370]|uniref:GCN5-related N-acetyltransferase n=1 Tax=Novosphingobium nitrogenifigens DSM 19370 TaxID=983920 RepID=F1Z880_9SPHN|nr:GNAT family N-acetyltransferase [Novosphingobium nitrogenifigens]EGD59145.1 GCN5-related N-acetyltransferase [Novosphingobium nitrogenifigens DSM 19370]
MTANKTLADLAQVTEMKTRDDVVLSVRPAYAEDTAALEAFFDAVSDDDRRFRFLTAVRHVGTDQITPLTHVDHWRTESFVAFDQATGELVASAMLACDARMDTGEIAVSIRRDYRGRGLGWTLLDLLASEAKRRGLKRVISIEDRDNHAAIELEREKGFDAHGVDGDPHLIMLEKRFVD